MHTKRTHALLRPRTLSFRPPLSQLYRRSSRARAIFSAAWRRSLSWRDRWRGELAARQGSSPSPSNKRLTELNLECNRFFGRPTERALARDPPTVRRQHWSEPLPNRAPLRPERASGRLPVLAEGSNQSGGSQTQLPERVIEVEPQVKEKGFVSCMPCWPWSPCCRGRSYIATS